MRFLPAGCYCWRTRPVGVPAASGLPHYSPTRKYLVRPEAHGLEIFHLTYGDLAGHLAFPEFVGLELKLADLDWSDDGKELAAVFRTSRDKASRIDDAWAVASWSMKDGSLVAQHAIERDVSIALNPYAARLEIDCLPDHAGWWVRNVAMIDRKSGKVVWTLPEPKNVRPPTCVLADGRLLVHGSTGGSPAMWMTVVEPPRKLLRMHGTPEELPVIEKLIANDPNLGIRLQAKSTADRIRQSNR